VSVGGAGHRPLRCRVEAGNPADGGKSSRTGIPPDGIKVKAGENDNEEGPLNWRGDVTAAATYVVGMRGQLTY